MTSPNGATILLVMKPCHNCGRNRPTTGTPATCLGCLKHYQKNLNKRASRQAAASQPLTPEAEDRRKTIQAMFDEALAEEMGAVMETGGAAATDEGFGESAVSRMAPDVLRAMSVRAARDFGKSKMAMNAFAEKLQAIQEGRLVVDEDVNTVDNGLEITGAAALPPGE